MTEILLHIIQRDVWEGVKETPEYRAPSLETQGFIHCSTVHNVLSVANFLFKDEDKLVLLCINPDKLLAKFKFEPVDNNMFPHIYGSLNTDAVERVLDFKKDTTGMFVLPESLKT